MNNETKGTLLILLTALESGVAIVFNKFFVQRINPTLFTALRAFFIGLIFYVITFFTKQKTKTPFKKIIWIGLIGGGLAFLLFFNGLKLTTSGRAAVIHKTLPIWASLMAFFFLKEKITRKQIFALLLAMLGFFIIEFENIPFSIKIGDFLALTATLLWALENTLSKKFMNQGESNWRITFVRMFFGSLFLFAVVWIQGNFHLIFELSLAHWGYIAFSTAMLTWYVFTWYWGLRYINLSKASSILLISPVIAMSLARFFLGEILSVIQICGSSLIIMGAFIIINEKSERRKKNELA